MSARDRFHKQAWRKPGLFASLRRRQRRAMTGVTDLVNKFTDLIIRPAVDVLFAAGFFLFVWGLIEFLRDMNEGSDTRRGKQHMLWGIVGMLIMISVLGILSLLNATFGFGIESSLHPR